MTDHIHSWHEFYANGHTKLRECFPCGALEVQLPDGSWVNEKLVAG
jgi:hypothetical protein